MGDLSITADDLIAMRPCDDWPESRIREIAGDKHWTALEILSLEQVPAADRLWVVLRPKLIPEPLLHELGCRFAEDVLPVWERQYPEDKQPHEAIAAKRAWLRGEIPGDKLDAARDAARDAAWAVASAAWAAAEAAAFYAARDAARDTADAAWDRYIAIVRAALESEVSDG